MVLPKRNFETANETEEQNIKAAVHDGMAHAVMVGAGETYFGPFGILLKASPVQLGLLASLPPFFGALAQVFSLHVLKLVRSRRFLIIAGARLQAASFLPLLLLAFIFPLSSRGAPFLIIFAMLYYAGAGFTVPLWSSLIGDLVRPELRGRFFGFRNQRAGFCALLATLAAGAALDQFDGWGLTPWGFALIFVAAAVARLRSAYWIRRYDDPEYHSPPEAYFSFWRFLTRARYSNFARFVVFFSSIHFGAAFSAPYFAPYMLRDLGFPYWEYTVVIATVTLTQIFTLHHWGRIADTFGSKRVLTFCSFGVAVNPFLWIFSSNVWWLIAVQIYSGIVWSGFNLASSIFLFDAVSAPKRARCAAYQALVQGAFLLAGSLAGGYTVQHLLPDSIGIGDFRWTPSSPYLLIFTISGCLRFAVAAVFRRRFSEVRDVPPTKTIGLLFHLFPFDGFIEGAIQMLPVTFRRRKG